MACRLTKEELDQQFEQFLRESVSDDSIEFGHNSTRPSVLNHLGNVPQMQTKKSQGSVPWWQKDDDSEECLGKGMIEPGKTFRKSLRRSHSVQEMEEDQLKRHCFEYNPKGAPAIFTRDSLEPEDLLVVTGSALSATALGLEQGHGEEERPGLLDDLGRGTEAIAGLTTLRRELESCSSTLSSPERREHIAMINQNQMEDAERLLASAKENHPESPAYSEDFDDDASDYPKEAIEKKPERCGMLAKVSLHDSLNSTDGPVVPPLGSEVVKRTEWSSSRMADASGPAATGQSYGQSGVSDMEALQEAYRQISHSVGEFEEREQEPSRSPASPVTPKCSRETLKHVSTVESDLPTAEELMRAIGPDSSFTYDSPLHLQNEAAVDVNAERMASDHSPVRAKTEVSAGALSGTASEGPTMMVLNPASPQQRHMNITEEVKRLMQEKEISPQESTSVSNKGRKKQQVLGRPNTTAPFSCLSKKAPVPSGRNKEAEIGLRSLPKTSAPSKTGQIVKPPSSLAARKSRSQIAKRTSIHSQTHIRKGPDSGLKVRNELLTSVQSFASFLEHQMEASGLQTDSPSQSDGSTQHRTERTHKSGKELMGNRGDRGPDRASEHSFLDRLSDRGRELLISEKQLQEEHSREVSALRQEIYMLESKLHSVQEASKKQRWNFGEASDPVTEEKLKLIEKEMKEQETLIQGYHMENEKLYLQMKALQAQSKHNEEAMFTENQRLLSELALTKEQLNSISKQKTVGITAVADPGCSVKVLMGQLQTAQKKEAHLQEEIQRLKQENQALQVDLQTMKKERDMAKVQVIYTSGDKGFELKLQEERHKEEVVGLRKRLQWYAENQQLLDKDAARLRAANAETQRLTEQVEKLKMEISKRTHQQQKKAKERAGEAKKIQDLERQVRELEEILRRRHPNSLPALIHAAAAAGAGREEEVGRVQEGAVPLVDHTVALLERRVRRLEAELEGCDEEAKRSLRAMEQQFHRVKLQYEQQISELEQQLAEQIQEQPSSYPEESQNHAQLLQQELEQLKEAYQSQVTALKAEVATLQEQLQQAKPTTQSHNHSRSPSRHQKQTDAAQTARIERLTQDLAGKSRTIQDLHRTVERLQRERRTMLFAPSLDGGSTQPRQYPVPAKDCPMPTETFPPTQDEKEYQPRAFSGSHISEVQKENERLRLRQEQLEMCWEQERVLLQTAVTQAQDELHRAQKRTLEELASLKVDHQREIEHLVARHALEHSSSKVAELMNQVKAHEIMVLHLREQLKELQGNKDALSVSKLREETLQSQLTKLLDELKQAKGLHSPGLRHFASLERKIHTMELRYNQREQELKQMIAQTRAMVEQEQEAEVVRWKRLAQGKSSELEAFRLELDSILDVLRELQKQGVVIPATKHSSAAGFIFKPLQS
ncbi:centrosomal protein of 162 kDa [Electrophorus electricus]|uniref:centrosomal protein of 162 kDa n=1 Tax=Electrophorus electricus TaxID=8005 RepID=UPI0015D0A4A9|nr:centrosomal protein of 162 kDa [Electrophorus electricus]